MQHALAVFHSDRKAPKVHKATVSDVLENQQQHSLAAQKKNEAG